MTSTIEMTNEQSTEQVVEWSTAEDNTQYTTRKFSETLPGIYHVTPLRRIHTKHGNQLICKFRNTKDNTEHETFVPNSFVSKLISMCGGVEHTCMLQYNGTKQQSNGDKKIPLYDFALGKIKGNPTVVLSRPVQESSW